MTDTAAYTAPDEVYLSDAAALVVLEVKLCVADNAYERGRLAGVTALWQELTGIADRRQALAYAHDLADQPGRTVAPLTPF